MPVNRNPRKRLTPPKPDRAPELEETAGAPADPQPKNPDEPTEADLAQKEWQDLWEENEPIDMDKW
jgi:hypothetical protein